MSKYSQYLFQSPLNEEQSFQEGVWGDKIKPGFFALKNRLQGQKLKPATVVTKQVNDVRQMPRDMKNMYADDKDFINDMRNVYNHQASRTNPNYRMYR